MALKAMVAFRFLVPLRYVISFRFIIPEKVRARDRAHALCSNVSAAGPMTV